MFNIFINLRSQFANFAETIGGLLFSWLAWKSKDYFSQEGHRGYSAAGQIHLGDGSHGVANRGFQVPLWWAEERCSQSDARRWTTEAGHQCWCPGATDVDGWILHLPTGQPGHARTTYLSKEVSWSKLRVTDGFILTSSKIIVSNVSPQWNLRLPEKTQCFVQILTLKPHPWCSSSNAICQQWLANHNQNRKTVLENKYPSRSLGAAIPLRSAQTELHKTIELRHMQIHITTWGLLLLLLLSLFMLVLKVIHLVTSCFLVSVVINT